MSSLVIGEILPMDTQELMGEAEQLDDVINAGEPMKQLHWTLAVSAPRTQEDLKQAYPKRSAPNGNV